MSDYLLFELKQWNIKSFVHGKKSWKRKKIQMWEGQINEGF